MNHPVVTPVRMRERKQYMLTWSVSRDTATRYSRAVTAFLEWAASEQEDAHTVTDFDWVLLEYLHYLYESGHGKSHANMTFYGIMLFMPVLKFQLPRSAQALRGWNKQVLSKHWPPLTWELAVAIAIQFVRWQARFRQAVAVLLSFDCLLRAGEMANLRGGDVADVNDLRFDMEHKGVVLRLRKTKTGENKSVTVLHPDVIALLRLLVRSTKKGALLFPFGAGVFRREFKQVVESLGLHPSFVPHSLRHGGATRYRHVWVGQWKMCWNGVGGRVLTLRGSIFRLAVLS